MHDKETFLKEIERLKKEGTYPLAFNKLNREIAKGELDEKDALDLRVELLKCTWEYLTADLPYDFFPEMYRTMRKIVRPHMKWILEHCHEDRHYLNRARFGLAMTAEGTTSAKEDLLQIGTDSETSFNEAAASLAQMIAAHEEACGIS